MTETLYLNALGMVSPLGEDKSEICRNLLEGRTDGMVPQGGWLADRDAFVGPVTQELPEITGKVSDFDSRNNRLLLFALQEIELEIQNLISDYGPDRIAVILGTSTSSVGDNEQGIAEKVRTGEFPAGFDYLRQDNASCALFVRQYLGLRGPAMTISTACTSSAKTLASARRLIQAGFCDAAIIGGADSLCRLTLNGFASLELLSEKICNPFSRNRNGINIGEAAALFVVSRKEDAVRLGGVGETSDAYHMSTPDPDGTSAEEAIRLSLAQSGMQAKDIGYINLHGTATSLNDSMEARVVSTQLSEVPASSTKPLTGHTLGAAGATELAYLWLSLHENYLAGQLPPHIWDGEIDPELAPINLTSIGDRIDPSKKAMMSNSFAFGGNNICVTLIGS